MHDPPDSHVEDDFISKELHMIQPLRGRFQATTMRDRQYSSACGQQGRPREQGQLLSQGEVTMYYFLCSIMPLNHKKAILSTLTSIMAVGVKLNLI